MLFALVWCRCGYNTGNTSLSVGCGVIRWSQGLRGELSPAPGWVFGGGYFIIPEMGWFFAVYQTPYWTRVVNIPLYPYFLATILLTAFLWWRDRRRIPPGHCQTCGYDLTGNVSGRCPECGEPA